jgi:hypothetical protein
MINMIPIPIRYAVYALSLYVWYILGLELWCLVHGLTN